jgi:hypothetical protein
VEPVDMSSTTSNIMYARLRDARGNVVGSGWIKLEHPSVGSDDVSNDDSESISTRVIAIGLATPPPSFTPATIEFSPWLTKVTGQDIEKITSAIEAEAGAHLAVRQDYRVDATDNAPSRKMTNDVRNANYTVRYGSEQITTYSKDMNKPLAKGTNGTADGADEILASSFRPRTPVTAHRLTAHPVERRSVSIGCFSRGVHLQKDSGLAAVETLRVGDRLLTHSGNYQPIVGICRRRYVCGAHPNPEQVWPVVIAAGAFDEGLPKREFLVNPGHAIFVDGRIVPAIHLVNGATIRHAPIAEVDYWRIDLPTHEVLSAEGLFSGSYVDVDDRLNFEGGDNMAQHPDFGPRRRDDTCVPYLDVAALPALRETLLRRAEDFGFSFVSDPDLHAIADGRRIDPVRLDENRFAFVFPPGVKNALLASRTWRPLEATPDNQDPRTLGVCISRLEVDGSNVQLAGEILAEGWHGYESEDRQRWTKGRATLTAGLRIALLDVCGVGRYLRHPRPVVLEA